MKVSSAKRIFAVVLIAHCTYIASWAKCVINVKENFNANSPLLLDRETLDIIHPKQLLPSILTFAAGEELLILCAGHQITRNNQTTDSESEVVRCVKDLKFFSLEDEVEFSFKDLSCSKYPEPIAWKDGRRCGRGRVIVNHGFSSSLKPFKTTIESCFVKDTMTTAWSHFKIPGSIEGKFLGVKNVRFAQGPYFGRLSLDDVYLTRNQRQTLMETLNDEKLVAHYMPQDGKGRNYFAKGHLAARADFFYWSEQRTTYFYVNVLPMWQSINNGNWRGVEGAVRRIASVEGDLEVWTGGLGVLELNGEEIFLAKDGRDESKLLVPAPKLLFKLVYSESKNGALVFVTANNPYLDEGATPSDYKICKKYRECNDKYKLFDRIFQGYTYCCLVEDFLNSSMVSDLNLPVNFSNVQPLTLA